MIAQCIGKQRRRNEGKKERRKRERQSETQKDRETERDIERHRETERGDIERDRERQRQRERTPQCVCRVASPGVQCVCDAFALPHHAIYGALRVDEKGRAVRFDLGHCEEVEQRRGERGDGSTLTRRE